MTNQAKEQGRVRRLNKLLNIMGDDRFKIWNHFESRAEEIRSRLWTMGTWLLGLLIGLLALVHQSGIVRFDVPVCNSNQRQPQGAHGKQYVLKLGWKTLGYLLILSGCSISKMNSNFDAQPLGVPAQFPAPTPPQDQFTWLYRQPLVSTLESKPGGGNWVRIAPTKAFLTQPDSRHQFLLASSDLFSANFPLIQGGFSIRIVGDGIVEFALQAVGPSSVRSFIGAGELATYATGPGGEKTIGNVGTSSSADDLDSFAWLDDSYNYFGTTYLAAYSPGRTVDFSYTINQFDRTFSLTLSGGAVGSREASYGFAGPIRTLMLWMVLRGVSGKPPAFFVDKIQMEEVRRPSLCALNPVACAQRP